MKKFYVIIFPLILLAVSVSLVPFSLSFFSDLHKSSSAKTGIMHSESWAALQFLSNSRAYPYPDIPADAYKKAELFYNAHFENQLQRKSEIQTSSWQSIGPNNIGGRTLAIALDPLDTATVWLGSASGGLWKSTTGGIGLNAWTYIPTGFPVRGVTSIAINPNNHNEIYIGTGETYTYASSVNGLIH